MQNDSPVPLFESKETEMLDIDQLLANMPKDEDELKTVQEKRRQILQENRDKETGMLPVALPTELSGF